MSSRPNGAFGTLNDFTNGRYYPASGLITLTYDMCYQPMLDGGDPDQFSPLSDFYNTAALDSDIIVNFLTPTGEFGDINDSNTIQKIRAPIFGIVADSDESNVNNQALGILFTYDIMTAGTRGALTSIFNSLGEITESALKALLPYLSFQTTKAVGIYWLPITAIIGTDVDWALKIREITSIQ